MAKKHNTKNIFLIDSLAIVFRAYHAIPSLQNNGKNLNSVYGFFSIFLKILNTYQVDYLVCTFDSKTASDTRKEKFNWYKATRKETPTDLIEQITILKDILIDANIPVIEKDRFEADDIIATFSKSFSKNKDIHIYIVTGDKDLLQLVGRDVSVIMPSKNFSDPNIINQDNVSDYLGFDSKYLVTYKSLMGDQSDNIPGVLGIGDKGAKSLITQFGDIYNIYSNLDNINESISSKLLNYKKDAFDSYQAASLFFNIPLKNLSLNNFTLNINTNSLVTDFEKYSFKSLINKYFKQFENTEISVDKIDETFDKTESFEPLDKLISKSKRVNITAIVGDSNKYPFATKPVGIVMGIEKKIFYVDLKNISEDILIKVKSILENRDILKIGYDIKFDKHLLSNIDITLRGPYFDTQIASFVCLGKVLTFKNVVFEIFGISIIEKDLNKKIDVDILDKNYLINNYMKYIDLIERLYKYFNHILKKDGKLNFVFYDINTPLIDILFAMEQKGILIDIDYLNDLYRQFDNKLNDLSLQIFKLATMKFNISSSQQLSDILFNKLNLPSNLKKTKTGRISTDSLTLSEIQDLNPIIPLIIKYKELSKIKSTYTKNLVDMAYKDNRLHTTYNIVGTTTGRISSILPNLQNIPIKTETGAMIRKGFISSNNKLFFSFDYSQIELRILAFYSKDKVMINAFLEDRDIHLYTASVIFEKDILDITKNERSIAKTINFGIIYGLSPFGLSKRLHISRNDAVRFINNYFDTFNGIKQYYDYIIEFVKTNSFVETIYGTKRVFNLTSGYRSDSQMIREAINMPIQGSSADIIKIAMDRIHKHIESKYSASLILQIHDELIFEVDSKTDNTLFVNDVIKCMVDDFNLNVPLKVDVNYGKNWRDLEVFRYHEK